MTIAPNYAHIDYRAWGFHAGVSVRYRLLSATSASHESTINDAISIALLLHCRIKDEIRGGIVGVDGWVPLGDKRAHIAKVAVLSDPFPILEVSTSEEYHHPLELEAIALNISRAVRASGRVQAGNCGRLLFVSIIGGTRSEIIGMPRIKYLPPLAHYEAIRQKSLLDLRDEMFKRGLTAEDFTGDKAAMDITGRINWNKPQLTPDEKIYALVLPGMHGLGEWETGPGCNLIGEIAGWLNAVNTEESGAIVWDEAQQIELRQATHAGDEDAVLVITDDTPVEAILQRSAEACLGIPREMRHWLPDNTTRFVRLLPDVEPEAISSNLPAVEIVAERVAAIRAMLPPSPFAREQCWQELGLHPELVRDMLDAPSPVQDLFEYYMDRGGRNYSPVAHFLSATLKRLKRDGYSEIESEQETLTRLVDAYRVGRIAQDGLAIGLEQYLAGGMEALEVYLDENPDGIANDPEGWAAARG